MEVANIMKASAFLAQKGVKYEVDSDNDVVIARFEKISLDYFGKFIEEFRKIIDWKDYDLYMEEREEENDKGKKKKIKWRMMKFYCDLEKELN